MNNHRTAPLNAAAASIAFSGKQRAGAWLSSGSYFDTIWKHVDREVNYVVARESAIQLPVTTRSTHISPQSSAVPA